MEVVLVPGGQPELEAGGRTNRAGIRKAVLEPELDVAHADGGAMRGPGERRQHAPPEVAITPRDRHLLRMDAHVQVRLGDRHEDVHVDVVEDAVRHAERGDVALELEAVAEPVRREADQVAGRIRGAKDDRIRRLELLDAVAVEGIELHVLKAHVHVELALSERLRALEEDRAERVRGADEGLEVAIVPVREAGGGGDDGQAARGGIRDVRGERIERRAARQPDGEGAGPELLPERAGVDGRDGRHGEHGRPDRTRRDPHRTLAT